MKAIFLCRFQKNPNDPVFKDIEDELKLGKVIDSDYDYEKERSILMANAELYDYAPILLDLKDICTSNTVDDQHTSVKLYNTFSHVLKVPFDKFCAIYQGLLAIAINDFTEIDFNKPNDTIIQTAKLS